MDTWKIIHKGFNPETHNHFAPVNTVGNGFFCCRGFMEEQCEGVSGLGGIYMAGVFGKASYTPYKGEGQELANIPNFFRACITVNGSPLKITSENLLDYEEILDMQEGIFSRNYTYAENGEKLATFEFSRFISYADIHLAGQTITVTPLKDGIDIRLDLGIDANITNLNEISSEPYPVQPGKKHLHTIHHDASSLSVRVDGPEQSNLAFVQQVFAENADVSHTSDTIQVRILKRKGDIVTIQKLVAISKSDKNDRALKEAQEIMADITCFADILSAHKTALMDFWKNSDVLIDGDDDALRALRYNILQLEQSCPRHTDSLSIGARGLTGEMYDGSVFWDTEIFMLPYFTMTDPDAARKLLMFRYHTLQESREHAISNRFEGAMYGWQVNAKGIEQTPRNAGAYYSVHIVADVAFAVLEYLNATGDYDFILDYGLEIIIETARYWASRVTKREDGLYDIMAVRGPNEYDVLVNNNLYTNMMARENFLLYQRIIDSFSDKREQLAKIKSRIGFEESETIKWQEIANNMVLPYHEELNLWLEDETWLRRKPLDLAKAKPTAKRIIDSTMSAEELPFYQVTKQADVLHLMKNLPRHFTKEQINIAYNHYKPRTAFDSSLAYSMFALMAAKLGYTDEALGYFDSSVNLDIRNVQLNTISGLHFANFGGSWQAAVFGFGGVTVMENKINIEPALPKNWSRMDFRLRYQGSLLGIEVSNNTAKVTMLSGNNRLINLSIYGKDFNLINNYDYVEAKRN